MFNFANVITLTLLHPLQSIPVRSWTFTQDDVIRIGRSLKNHVVLYSAVVSRYHVEIRHQDNTWVVVNLGINGTYVNGQAITEVSLVDGQVIHLAMSGPRILLNIEQASPEPTQDLDTQQKSTTAEALYPTDILSSPLPNQRNFSTDDEETEADIRKRSVSLPIVQSNGVPE